MATTTRNKVITEYELRSKGDKVLKEIAKNQEAATKSAARMERQMKRMAKSSQSAAKTLKLFGAAVAGAFVLQGARSLVSTIRATREEMDKMAKSASAINVSVTALSDLSHVASLAGVNSAQLTKGMTTLTKNIGEAERGMKTYADALTKIGLTSADLINLSPDEQFKRVGSALAGVANTTDRVNAAYNLMGRNGVALLNMMKDGNEAFNEQIEFARKLRGALNDIDYKKVEMANDALSNTARLYDSSAKLLTAAVAPVIQHINEMWLESILAQRESGKTTNELSRMIVTGMDYAVRAIQPFIAAWHTFRLVISGLAKLWAKMVENFLKGINAIVRKAQELNQKLPEAFQVEWINNLNAGLESGIDFMKGFGDEAQASMDRAMEAIANTARVMFKGTEFAERFEEVLARVNAQAKAASGAVSAMGASGDSANPLESDTAKRMRAGEATKRLAAENAKWFEEQAKAWREFQDSIQTFSGVLENTLQNNLNKMFDGVLQGTQSLKDGVKDLVRVMLAEFAKLAAYKTIMTLFGGGDFGAAFNKAAGGGITPWGHGGIVTGPTMAAGGNLLGESGPEAIMPLSRLSGGDLGIKAAPMNVTVNNNAAGVEVATSQDANGGLNIDIISRTIATQIANGGSQISSAIERAYGVNRGVSAG